DGRGPGWNLLRARAGLVRTWGDCYGYALVATGRAEVMLDPRLAPWDAAALRPIIEEAGGVFTDWDGNATHRGGHGIATNAALARVGRARLAQAARATSPHVRNPRPAGHERPRPPRSDPIGAPGGSMHARGAGARAVRGSHLRSSAMRIENEDQLDRLDFAKGQGLVPVVAQHARTGEVLMVGYANREALARTLETGVVWYYSRSRQRLWQKGETSGNVHRLVSLHTDCDGDAIVARVDPAGPTCHTGDWSCFGAPPTLAALSAVLQERLAAPPERSYTAKLLADRNLRLKKLG